MIYSKIPFRLQYIEDNGNLIGEIDNYVVLSKSNQPIAEFNVDPSSKLDAEYIVKACNQYPVLLDLLTRFRYTLPENSIYRKLIEHHINQQ